MFAYELQLKSDRTREQVVSELARERREPLLILDTCQRLECFGVAAPEHEQIRVSRTWRDADAFERLTRIAAGLESRILGELEVLGQVRRAYRQFRERHHHTTGLDRVFQDALALARRARRESGIDRNLTSLSGIAARELLNRTPPGEPLAVVGTGSLAGSIARYLGKRGQSPVRITSRCPENAITLALEIGGFGAGLEDMSHLFDNVAGIISATAAPHAVIYPSHIESARRPLAVIDMGVPPDCDDAVRTLPELDYVELDAIESKAQVNVGERHQRAQIASRIIRDGAIAWAKGR